MGGCSSHVVPQLQQKNAEKKKEEGIKKKKAKKDKITRQTNMNGER